MARRILLANASSVALHKVSITKDIPMHPVHLALSKSIRFWVLVACAMKWMMYVYVHYTDSDCQKECLFFAYLL